MIIFFCLLILCRDSRSEVPSKIEDVTKEDLPLFMYTQKPCPAKNLKSTTATVEGHTNLGLGKNPLNYNLISILV